jgi:hypothetical protein
MGKAAAGVFLLFAIQDTLYIKLVRCRNPDVTFPVSSLDLRESVTSATGAVYQSELALKSLFLTLNSEVPSLHLKVF